MGKATPKLSPRAARFVAEYLVDCNAAAAARRAGYSQRTAHSQGGRLLRNVAVAQAIAAAQARRVQRVEVTADAVVRELSRVAFSDVGQLHDADGNLLPLQQLPEDARRAVVQFEAEAVGQDGEAVTQLRRVKLADKLKALELLARHLGMLRDKVEHSGTVTLEELVLGSYREGKP